VRFLGDGLVVLTSVHAAAVATLVLERRTGSWRWQVGPLVSAFGALIGAGLAGRLLAAPAWWGVCWAAAALAIVSGYGWWRRDELRASGAAAWSSLLAFHAVVVFWGVEFLVGLPVSGTTKLLLWPGALLALVCLPSSLVTQREALEVVLRRRWAHQHEPLSGCDSSLRPFVSIQVPCHAEPPDLVISTLDRLAALDYPAFEVVVIDNNTADPFLWQPVQEHCERLGDRFRFAHVEGISGAKAGALNWGRQLIDPRAALVAVVDADYHVHSRWLNATVGFFDDSTVGFVQPPHAYRDWRPRRFGRMANYEYGVFFAAGMVGLQEHEAGITVGTMSVIRLDVLDDAGGWAEWCQTEDSELAIRIHDFGYRSVYLRKALGWGLIPDTFAGYRQQRYRWTYGPVQELKRHWRRFLPQRWGGSALLSPSQKLHHANHGLNVATVGLRLLAWPVGLAAAASLLAHHERVPIPFELWFAATVVLTTGLILRWAQYQLAGASAAEAVGAAIAYRALAHTIVVAALTALIGREVPWRRTSKFRSRPRRAAAVASVRVETALAAAYGIAAAATITLGTSGLATLLGIGFAAQAAGYASAPLVALVADRDLKLDPEPAHSAA
jgi:Glycosyltransferase like family 2